MKVCPHRRRQRLAFRLRSLAAAVLLAAICTLAAPPRPAVAQDAGTAAPGLSLPIIAFRVEDESARQAAEKCAAVWTAEAPRLASALGLAPPRTGGAAAPDTVECLVLGTASFSRLFAGRIPDWGVGVALPGGRVVAIDHVRLPAVGRGLREVFLHEMTHALLMRAGGGAALPSWLHEGLAMRLSGEWRFTDTVTLAMEGRVPNLSDLWGAFPGGAQRANRAYLTSELAVGRLLDTYGAEVVPRLLEAVRRTGDFRQAFEQVTGAAPEVFENRFASAMNLRFGWLVVITRWPALFVLLALVLVAGAGARLVRNRRRLAGMPDDEPGPQWPAPEDRLPGEPDIAPCPADED